MTNISKFEITLPKGYVNVFKYPELSIVLATIITNAICSYILFTRDPNSFLYYGDAVSHLVIARTIFDSILPGLAQLGTTWLPITHIMLLPFVTNDFLFHTGLAGAIVSTGCSAITNLALYRIVKMQFSSAHLGLLASALYLMNPSVIYMEITPMMEAPFMMFFMVSVYYLQKWWYYYHNNIWKQYRTLIKCALAISAATLTRYEGWILPFGIMLSVFIVMMITKREVWRYRVEAIMTFVGSCSFAGIIIWIVWNFVTEKDPLYFATAASSSTYPFAYFFKSDPIKSFSIIFEVAKAMYGLPVLILAGLGIASYLYMNKSSKLFPFSLLTLVVLMMPILFEFIAMVQGSLEIYPTNTEGSWYNGRYLIFLAPFLIFVSVSLVKIIINKRKKMLTIIAVALVIESWMFAILIQNLDRIKVVAMNDAFSELQFTKESQMSIDTSNALKQLYVGGNILLFTESQQGHLIMLNSNLPLKDFIDIGSGMYWDISKDNPWIYGDYIVLNEYPSSEDKSDLTYKAYSQWLTSKYDDLLTKSVSIGNVLYSPYHIVYDNGFYVILKRSYR
ncbi:MAG: hypothetical protein JO297_20045 [Nitrososphaeraceae archaeon]|nr:hypothetical protein [Nitrososphaeraceae archaeon]